MTILLTLALEAHNPERRHHRRYEVSVETDLLGDWLVVFRHGRAGAGLRAMPVGGLQKDAAQREVVDRLRRRLSAPRRLGCAYQILPGEVFFAEGEDPHSWLPAEYAAAARWLMWRYYERSTNDRS